MSAEPLPRSKNQDSAKEHIGGIYRDLVRPVLAGIGALTVAGHLTGELPIKTTGETRAKTDQATEEISKDIALKHSVSVLEGGEAVVSLKDGTRINIKNPILGRNGEVAERTRGSDEGELSAVTTYAEGEGSVADIAYFDDGKPISSYSKPLDPEGFSSPSEAVSVTTPVQVERVEGLSGSGEPSVNDGANYFVVSPSARNQAGDPQEHIAEGTVYPEQPRN